METTNYYVSCMAESFNPEKAIGIGYWHWHWHGMAIGNLSMEKITNFFLGTSRKFFLTILKDPFVNLTQQSNFL